MNFLACISTTPSATSSATRTSTSTTSTPPTEMSRPRSPSTPQAPLFEWNTWNENWSLCSKYCDYGVQQRERTCPGTCVGSGSQTRICINDRCPGEDLLDPHKLGIISLLGMMQCTYLFIKSKLQIFLVLINDFNDTINMYFGFREPGTVQ